MVIDVVFETFKESWSGFPYDISVNLIASVIVFLTGVFYAFFRNRIYRVKRRNVTKFNYKTKDDKKVVSCYSAHSEFRDELEKVDFTFFFEDMAYSTISEYLLHIHKETEFKFDLSPLTKKDINTILTSNDMKGDIVLLGGPNHNSLTNVIFGLKEEYSNVPLHFGTDLNTKEEAALFVTDKEDKSVTRLYVPKKKVIKRKGEEVTVYNKDYGLILNVKNPFEPKSRILAFIGCRSAGVYAAASYFTNHSKKLKKNVKGIDEYAVIVECQCDDRNIHGDPIFKEAVALESIKPEMLSDEKVVDKVITPMIRRKSK